MRTFFLSLFATFFLGAAFVSAQTREPFITVATVNIQNIQFLKQEGNVFTFAFDISNREGIQPEVIYSVKLLKKESRGFSLADQKVYGNDILRLGTNDSVHKVISYSVPSYLKGTYVIEVEAKNADGMPFGLVQLPGEIVLNGTGEYISVDSQHCYLTVPGEKGNKKYTLLQGVDIVKEESLTAHCPVTNAFTGDKTITPVFETRYRSAYGKTVGVEKQTPVTLKAGQKADFTATLPKANEPQAYDVILAFMNEKQEVISSSIVFHYVLRGESATMQNLTTDKSSYLKRETANVSFFWSGAADGFPGSRLGTSNLGKEVFVTFAITDASGNACASPFVSALKKQGGAEHVSIPLTSDCKNPVVAARISDQDKKVLTEKTYEMNPKAETENTAFSISFVWMVFGLVVRVVVSSDAV